jgi:hypothetical protein
LALKRFVAVCYREPMGRWLLALALAFTFATSGYAQLVRKLPPNGKLGELVGQQPLPILHIDKEQLRLAPGGLIFDQENRTMLHGRLPERATILYVRNATGEVSRIYLLRPDEIEFIKRTKAR